MKSKDIFAISLIEDFINITMDNVEISK